MPLDFPKTEVVWDRDIEYKKVFNEVIKLLKNKAKVKILAPGAGHGRFIIDFLKTISNRMSGVKVLLVIVEADEVAISKLSEQLKKKRFVNIEYELKNTTLEKHLTTNKIQFDLIFCLLFFHYVSHCWISLLSELFKVLKKDGIFLFDEIIGKTEEDQLILQYIDSEFTQLYSRRKLASTKTKNLRDFFRQFYSFLLREESILWSSSVKGTNVERVVGALKPLFMINNKAILVYRTSPLKINILDAIKKKKHLPFWYGTTVNNSFERVSERIKKSNGMLSYLQDCKLSTGFRFYIFSKKKQLNNDQLERHWDTIKSKSVLHGLQMINMVLPQVPESGTITYSDQHSYVHSLQMAAVHLLLTSGIFSWDSKINSIFVVQGQLTASLHTPKLSKIVILNKYSPHQRDRDVLSLAWLINYALYAGVLKTSLSEKFIATGRMVEIIMDETINELQINEQGLNGQLKITIPNKTKVYIDYDEEKLKTHDAEIEINVNQLIIKNIVDKVKRFIWHDVIELERKMEIPSDITEIASFIAEKVPQIKINPENSKHIEKIFSSKETEKIIRYLGVLLGNVGNIIFVPIPTVFSIDSHKYESLIGIGIAIKGKIEKKDYDECKYIKNILRKFFRPFQEAYLGLHWVEVSRRHAMRAAVAAISGRNMSHNIGSHVLANIIQLENCSFNAEKAKKLFKFLQQRMDFIAQVSTTAPTWTFDVRLGDIIDSFNEQKYLKDFIADFKNLNSDKIKVKFSNPTEDKPKEIAIPTGTIGCHALFSILENIIRNAARHGMKDDQQNLELSIDIEDKNWRFYKVTIMDNCSNSTKAGDLNSKFATHILDGKGELKREDWGMKEKKILFCYLRLIAQEDVDEKYKAFLENPETSDEPPIIRAIKNGNLAYEFYLLKTKKVFVISDKVEGNDGFRKAGIDFANKDEFKEIDRVKIIHKFLIIDLRDTLDSSWLQENIIKDINRLPFRVLVIGDGLSLANPLKNIICCRSFDGDCFDSPEKFYEWIWKRWVSGFLGDNYQLVIRQTYGCVADNLKNLSDNPQKNLKKCQLLHIKEDKETNEKKVKKPSSCVLLDHQAGSDNSYLYGKVACHIPYRSGTPIFDIITMIPEKHYHICEFIEMGVARVAIVDDRIWKAKDKPCSVDGYNTASSKKLFELWKKKGVDIRDVDCAIKKFGEFVNKFPGKKFHFLIFHQGEIDEIKKRIGEANFRKLWDQLKSKVVCTVIDTGRGVPPQALIDNLRWMSYSILQECLVEKAGDSLSKKRLLDYLISLRAEDRSNV